MVNRWIERDLVDVLGKHGVGAVAVTFSLDELTEIDHHARDPGIDLWAESSSA